MSEMSEMSNEKQETVADIVAEKRREAQHIRNINDTPRGRREALDLDEEADRIEAAVEFTLAVETAKSAGEGFAAGEQSAKERSCKLGNAAAIREALSDACYAMHNFLKTQNGGCDEMAKALDKAKSALSAPARNCDVGTVEEQSERYHALCDSNKCTSCPCKFTVRTYCALNCALIWEQMPYEEGGAK